MAPPTIPRPARQTVRQQRRAPVDGSGEKQFQMSQLINLVDFATRFTWSPWRETQTRAITDDTDDNTDATQLRRWRLKCDLMRVATYYRVTGAQARVDARKRSDRIRARFREWAASVRRERGQRPRGHQRTERRGRTASARRANESPAARLLLGGTRIQATRHTGRDVATQTTTPPATTWAYSQQHGNRKAPARRDERDCEGMCEVSTT